MRARPWFWLPVLGSVLLSSYPARLAALETARMALPEGFVAATERIAITGYGGRNRGQYRLGDYSGEFTRIESRWAVFDPLFAGSRAKSSFTITGPGLPEITTATCGMKKNTVSIGVVTFDPKKMSYQCSFERGGQLMNARYVLGHPKPENMRQRFLAWERRAGVAELEGERIVMRSVHEYAGTEWQSPTPVGYLLEIDDRTVGAIELTDVNPTLFLPPRAESPLRERVLLVAMALSVLRDPADSALGD